MVEKMEMVTQYTFAGDFTGECIGSMIRSPSSFLRLVEAIDIAVKEVAKYDAGWFLKLLFNRPALTIPFADDWFVIAITDANFDRYGITPEELKRVMIQQPKVRTALICIGEGAEAFWWVNITSI